MRRILRRIAAPDVNRHVRDRAADNRANSRVDHADLDALPGDASVEEVRDAELAHIPRRGVVGWHIWSKPIVRAVVVRLRQREAPDLAGLVRLGRGNRTCKASVADRSTAVAEVEVPFRVGERLEILVGREDGKLLERDTVVRLPDAMLNRRGRIALHSHHIKITANCGKVDRVRVAVFKDESLRGDLAARVHRRRECP